LVVVGVWSLLRSSLRCQLLYGKDLCLFYEVSRLMTSSPSEEEISYSQELCQEIGDFDQKEACLEYLGEMLAPIYPKQAKESCSLMVGQNEDRCLQRVETAIEKKLAEEAVTSFLAARLQRDQEAALLWLTEKASGLYLSESDLSLIGLSNPHFSDFSLLEKEKLDNGQFRFLVRIYEEYTGQGGVGYFEETLFLSKSGEKYLIDSFERGKSVGY
jgi:hypothetical protein